MADWGSSLEPKLCGKGISKYFIHNGGDHICFLRGELHPFFLCIPHQFHSPDRCELYFVPMVLPGDEWYFAPSTRKPLQKIGNTSRLFPSSAPGDILARVPSTCVLGDPAASNRCLCKTWLVVPVAAVLMQAIHSRNLRLWHILFHKSVAAHVLLNPLLSPRLLSLQIN